MDPDHQCPFCSYVRKCSDDWNSHLNQVHNNFFKHFIKRPSFGPILEERECRPKDLRGGAFSIRREEALAITFQFRVSSFEPIYVKCPSIKN